MAVLDSSALLLIVEWSCRRPAGGVRAGISLSAGANPIIIPIVDKTSLFHINQVMRKRSIAALHRKDVRVCIIYSGAQH